MHDTLAPFRRLLHPCPAADDQARLAAAVSLMAHTRPGDREAEACALSGVDDGVLPHPSAVLCRVAFWAQAAVLASDRECRDYVETAAALRLLRSKAEAATTRALQLLRDNPTTVAAFVPAAIAGQVDPARSGPLRIVRHRSRRA